MKINTVQFIKRRASLLLAVIVTAFTAIAMFPSTAAQAGTITNRKVSLYSVANNNAGSNVASATGITYTFSAKPSGSYNIGSAEVDICTSPFRGTACTAPTGLAFSSSTLTQPVPAGGTPTLNGALTGQTPNANLGTGSTAARIRTTYATPQAVTVASTISFEITGITNTSTAGTFYVRIGYFSDSAWTTFVDGGAAANSINALQNVSFKVQETLGFCVGGMANGTVAYNAFAAGTLTNDCAQSSATALSLGTAPDASTVCITPVSAHVVGTTCDDSGSVATTKYGFAMLRTNASLGAIIGYRPNNAAPFQQNTMQVSGATCVGFAAAYRTDSCINPVNEDQTIASGTVAPFITGSGTNELFGMAVPAVSSTGKSTSVLTNNPASVSAANRYIGSGNASGGTACTTGGSAAQDCWNWNRTGTAIIASAPSPVDNEGLQIVFASKPASTTPTGSYAVDVDYWAVPTY